MLPDQNCQNTITKYQNLNQSFYFQLPPAPAQLMYSQVSLVSSLALYLPRVEIVEIVEKSNFNQHFLSTFISPSSLKLKLKVQQPESNYTRSLEIFAIRYEGGSALYTACPACKYSSMGRLAGILICSHPWPSLA